MKQRVYSQLRQRMESEEVDIVEVRSWRMLLTCRISWIAAAGDKQEQRGEDVENMLKSV